jgi:chromosome transmission fidelity protein 18
MGSQEWELAPYLSSPVLAFHHLFASSSTARQAYAASTSSKTFNNGTEGDESADFTAPTPFSGPGAAYSAAETLKANKSAIQALQTSLALRLARMYRSHSDIATELLPFILRMLAPDIKPVVITHGSSASGNKGATTASVRKASEKALVARAVECMAATGVRFEKTRVEHENAARNNGGFVYRMEPALDALGAFGTMSQAKDAAVAVRYAVRQVLEMEWKKDNARRNEDARRRRTNGGKEDDGEVDKQEQSRNADDAAKKATALERTAARAIKRDFFGRIIKEREPEKEASEQAKLKQGSGKGESAEGKVWVSFHEGFSNAVRKPVTLAELMRGL